MRGLSKRTEGRRGKRKRVKNIFPFGLPGGLLTAPFFLAVFRGHNIYIEFRKEGFHAVIQRQNSRVPNKRLYRPNISPITSTNSYAVWNNVHGRQRWRSTIHIRVPKRLIILHIFSAILKNITTGSSLQFPRARSVKLIRSARMHKPFIFFPKYKIYKRAPPPPSTCTTHMHRSTYVDSAYTTHERKINEQISNENMAVLSINSKQISSPFAGHLSPSAWPQFTQRRPIHHLAINPSSVTRLHLSFECPSGPGLP